MQPGLAPRAGGAYATTRAGAYTVHDDAATVSRIEGDLAHVVQTVRAGDPGLRALVLTGGFARGEGAMLDGKPQNDYDFVAVRGWRRPRQSYAAMRTRLEADLGLHIDLATAASWRLPHVAASLFWYETALRGRVLWGERVLHRIRVRHPLALDRAEGLRLLVNRSAGLLLCTETTDAHAVRLQSAKALLAASDVHLLSQGEFPPSQSERWRRQLARRAAGRLAPALRDAAAWDWTRWAFGFKVDPGSAETRDADAAWRAARRAVLGAVPTALRHAGLPSLDAYAHRDGVLDHLVYLRRAAHRDGIRSLVLHPTGRVRVGTLRLLEEARDGRVPDAAVRTHLRGMVREGEPLRLLAALRSATLQ